ncbi:PAS domain-containing protein [Flavobacteriales bacterium]|nr:PAS domain-containing protein [Flavobacteriales bacterium]
MEKQVELENAFLRCTTENEARDLISACKKGNLMISIHDTQGMYYDVSDSCFGFLQYTPEKLNGTSAYDYFHPEDFQAILKSHAKVTIKPEIDEVMYRLKNANGVYQGVRSLSKTLKDNTGKEIIIAFTIQRA